MPVAPPQTAKGLKLVNVSVMISQKQRGNVLTPSELRLVRYLAGHAGRFVDDWELRDYLYQGVCSDSLIKVHVSHIRSKLGRSFIETGELGGYRLSSQRAAALERVCARCGRPVVQSEGEWVCYGCCSTQHSELDVGRADGPGERSGTAWTDEERQYVLAHLDDMTLEELGAAVGRSESAVRGELAGLGIRKTYVRSAPR